jgi:hypothetical protein
MTGLPLRHRAALAGVLFLIALVAGAWASTHVGDDNPTLWGVGLGSVLGAALGLAVLVGRRNGRSSSLHLL